jgi:short-subunit dehydrogenase
MKNKNIIITGASSGLGRSMALYLSKFGANLVLMARSKDKLQELKKEIENISSNKVEIFITDVAKKESVKSSFIKAQKYLGTIDAVIANAGISMWSRFSDLSDPDELKRIMDINYLGLAYSLFYSLPALKNSMGSFVAISSIQGKIPVPYHSGYVASKYAVQGLIETLRLEEPEVHFLLALPSWISGTDLRSNAVIGDKKGSVKVSTKHKSNAIDVDIVAQKIIEALNNKNQEIYLPSSFKYLPLARVAVPSLLDKIVAKKVARQLKN